MGYAAVLDHMVKQYLRCPANEDGDAVDYMADQTQQAHREAQDSPFALGEGE
jgi:hypothetical protein